MPTKDEWVQRYVQRILERGSTASHDLLKSLGAAVFERLGHLEPELVADDDWREAHPDPNDSSVPQVWRDPQNRGS